MLDSLCIDETCAASLVMEVLDRSLHLGHGTLRWWEWGRLSRPACGNSGTRHSKLSTAGAGMLLVLADLGERRCRGGPAQASKYRQRSDLGLLILGDAALLLGREDRGVFG